MSLPKVDGPDEGIGIYDTNADPVNEKTPVSTIGIKDEAKMTSRGITSERDLDATDTVIITGADVSSHLVPLRDDFDTAVTFRSIFLASALVCFSASISQIYSVLQSWNFLAVHEY